MTRWVWLLPVGLALVGALRLEQGDVAAARALHAHAEQVAPDDWSHPVWVDAHREWSRVRPWQSGYPDARTAAKRIARGRRGVLR